MKLPLKQIDRFGDLQFNYSEKDYPQLPFSFGDVVKITINESDFIMPYCHSITDVLPGYNVLCFEGGLLSICILNGNFATHNNIANYIYDSNDEVIWNYEDISCEICLYEKEAYLSKLQLITFRRTNDRSDYSSDEVFANFRSITNNLYRSSTPLLSKLNRNIIADQLLEKYHINTILNLSDSKKKIEDNLVSSSYYEKLYQKNNIIIVNINSDLSSIDFKKRLCKSLKNMLKKKPPYLVHCIDGKDRTGFVIFILMALLDYSKEDITKEYLKTYISYYHLQEDSPKYEYLKTNALDYFFKCIGGTDNLKELATNYLIDGGLDINIIKELEESIS